MSWNDAELALVALGAMLSPLTLMWSVLALVLSRRPLRTGIWFYLGAVVATLAIGVAAAFVLGDAAASHSTSTPKTWVAVLDVLAAVALLVWVVRLLRHPRRPEKEAAMIERMSGIASSPAVAIFGAGAVLANPGVFIPLALKAISELNPTTWQYVAEWVAFTLVSLLPLTIAIVMLNVAHDGTEHVLGGSRQWLQRHIRAIGAAIIIALAASLLRGGIAGLKG